MFGTFLGNHTPMLSEAVHFPTSIHSLSANFLRELEQGIHRQTRDDLHLIHIYIHMCTDS